MSGLIEFLTTEEMIVVYVLVGIASVLYFVIYFLDKTAIKRKQRQNTRELEKIVLEDFSSIDKKETSASSEPVLVPIVEEQNIEEPALLKETTLESVSEISSSLEEAPVVADVSPTSSVDVPVETLSLEEEKPEVIQIEESTDVENIEQEELQYTTIEPNPTEAQAELMKLTETLEKAEEEVKNIDLTAFEEEQEQNAIISLEELMNRNKALYESGELETLDDEGNEPISLQDLEERMKQSQENTVVVAMENEVSSPSGVEATPMVLDDFQTVSLEKETVEEKPVYQEHKKFKSSPVISPVYGIESTPVHASSDIALENTANYEKLDEEIRKTNEFLMTLKELQKNLD